jgi:hypothetical protein
MPKQGQSVVSRLGIGQRPVMFQEGRGVEDQEHE